MLLVRAIVAILLCAGGLTLAYCGSLAFDIAPGIPLGLGMMYTGVSIALFGPMLVFLK